MSRSDRRPKVFVHLDQGRAPGSASNPLAPHPKGQPAPYGFGSASGHVDLYFSHDTVEGRLTRFFRRGISWVMGFDVIHAWRNRSGLNAADVIWTRTEHEYLAVAVLKKIGAVGRGVKVIAGSIWLWDHWDRMWWPKKAAYRWLLQEVDLHTTQTQGTAAVGRRVCGTDLIQAPYGGSKLTGAGDPLAPRRPDGKIHVIAPGSDRHRDWETLARVAELAGDLQVTFVSRRWRAKRAAARSPARITVTSAGSRAEMRELYATADVVAIPLRPNLHASGSTSLFEGLAFGVPVAVTDVGGLRYFFDGLVAWARESDPHSLLDAVRTAYAEREHPEELRARRERAVGLGLTIEDYARRFVIMTEYLLGARTDTRAASALEPVVLSTDQWPQES